MHTTENLALASQATLTARDHLTDALQAARPGAADALRTLIERAHTLACDIEELLADINAG